MPQEPHFFKDCQSQVDKMQLQIDSFSKIQEQMIISNAQGQDICRIQDLHFYQMFCLILAALCICLVLSLTCVYFQMRRKINKLVQIHDFGLPEDQFNQMIKEQKEGVEMTPSTGEETKEDGAATSRPLNGQQQSRDALIRIIKFQLDQYLRHSNANVAVEDLNYNFGDDKNYFDAKDPFKVCSEVTDAQPSPSVHDADIECASWSSKKKKLSGQETSILHQFKSDYDLNQLVAKNKIQRLYLDIKNLRMLQLFMQQLKQFLMMLQAQDESNLQEILKRYDVLKKMWMLEEIKIQLEDITAKIQAKEMKDPRIMANYPQIQIVLQILGIIMDDAQSLVENQKRINEVGAPSENLNNSYGGASSFRTDTRRSRTSNPRTPANRRNVNIVESGNLGQSMRARQLQNQLGQGSSSQSSPYGAFGNSIGRNNRMQSILKRPTPPLNLNVPNSRSYQR